MKPIGLRSAVAVEMHTSPSLASLPSHFLKQKSSSRNSFHDFFEVVGLNKRVKVRFFFIITFTSLQSMCCVFSRPLVSIFNTVKVVIFFLFLVHVSYKNPQVVFQGVCTFVLIFDICREKLTKNLLPERKNYFC